MVNPNLRHCKLAMGLIRLDVRQTLHRPHESLAVHLKHTHKKGSSVLHNARNSNGIPVALCCALEMLSMFFFIYLKCYWWRVYLGTIISSTKRMSGRDGTMLFISFFWVGALKSRLKKCRKNDKRTPIMYIHEFIPVICWNHISHAGSSWQTCKDTKNWLLHQLAVIEFSQVDMDNYLCYVPLALAWTTKAHRNIIMNWYG